MSTLRMMTSIIFRSLFLRGRKAHCQEKVIYMTSKKLLNCKQVHNERNNIRCIRTGRVAH